MRTMSVREVNQNFSKVIGLVEQGETILISKHGKTVAKLAPEPHDKTQDPEWRAAYARLVEHLKTRPRTGEPIGRTTREEIYGEIDP